MTFDDLIRAGRDTEALRMMARDMYDKGRIGHTRMTVAVRVADELDEAKKELSFSRSKTNKQSIRDFLTGIAAKEIVPKHKYSHRIEVEDGGFNSYIGLNIEMDDWKHKGSLQELTIFRHTNSTAKLKNEWKFSLGSICHPLHESPDIPLEYSSYGKTADEAEAEAQTYFAEMKRLIRKATSDYKIRAAETAQEEKEKLLARLSELEEV